MAEGRSISEPFNKVATHTTRNCAPVMKTDARLIKTRPVKTPQLEESLAGGGEGHSTWGTLQ